VKGVRSRGAGALSVFLLAGITSACSDVLIACSGTGQYPIRAIVHDSITREPAAIGSRLILHYGFRIDTTFGVAVPSEPLYDSTLFGGAVDATGVFAVKVEREGYRVWMREDVVVRLTEDGPCAGYTLEPVTLRVLLQPQP